jgi:predicted ester cyclase
MGVEENKDFIRRCFDALVNGRNASALEEYCADTFFDHNPPAGAPAGGIAAAREGFERLYRGLPDVLGRIEEMVAEGDYVFVRSILSGTHFGDLMGLQATGKRLALETWHLFRVDGGKIAEHRAQADSLMLLRQVAASPRQMAEVILVQPRDTPTTQA